MTAAERWLRHRLPGAPPRLMAAMVRALPSVELPVPDALAEGALSLYRSVSGGESGRSAALPLLAADALLTHAFQAQAELDPARTLDLVQRWGAEGRLGELASRSAG